MTFFCVNCFEELPGKDARCPRCGAAQDVDRRDYVAKLRKALGHPMAETRRRAIFLLGEKRVAEAVGELAEILDHESDPFLAETAAEALGKIQGDEALSALARAARHGSFMVRVRAIRALAEAGGEWARMAERIAGSDPSSSVRNAVKSER